MGIDPSRNYQSLLREGIYAAQVGNRTLAWSLLTQAAQMNPMDATPWIWLTETTDDLLEKKGYLENALAADPRNVNARRGLALINGEPVSTTPPFTPDSLEQITKSDKPVTVKTTNTFLCSKCGGNLAFDIDANSLICHHCGFFQEISEFSAADQEQVMDRVLPTERGHRWAASQHQMFCNQCGAHSLWPPGQAAAGCPYCGSHHLMESQETENLLDPQGLAIMQIDELEALKKVANWLGKGWTTPDDLKKSARKTRLRPAYYPFWTFDGTLEIHWSCEVNEGHSNRTNWVTRSGIEFEMFDDILVPGLKSLKFKDLNRVGKFNLKDIVAFRAEFLAGWPALTYDRPLSEATLLAREQVVHAVRRGLHSRVLPGQQKRGLEAGGVNWSDMTFKHVLLPVWIGWYRYLGREYRVMINGQTGGVAGEKPKDRLKLVGIILSLVVTLIVLSLIGVIIANSMGWP